MLFTSCATFLKFLDSTVSAHGNYSMAKVWLGIDNVTLGKDCGYSL